MFCSPIECIIGDPSSNQGLHAFWNDVSHVDDVASVLSWTMVSMHPYLIELLLCSHHAR